MKRCLCTLLDDNFVIGLEVFWKSFIHYNKWFKDDFVIIDCGLSEGSKEKISSLYDKVIFEDIQKENYTNIDMSITHKKLKNTYYTFEVFRLDYDRVVFMDMDILVLQDLSELFEFYGAIAGCKAFNFNRDRLSMGINTGVFVINKEHLSDTIYKDIIEFSKEGFTMPDQHAINNYFGQQIKYFNKKYNVEKRMLTSRRYRQFRQPTNIAVLHFVSCKPWQDKVSAPRREQKYEIFEKLWRQWRDK